MTVNLMIRSETPADHKATWAAITAIAPNQGYIWLDDETVNAIARLLDGQVLSNDEPVAAYPMADDDMMAPYVSSFGPSLLPTQVQDQIRDRLASTENGKDAVRLFNEIIRLGLQVRFSGKEHCPAYIVGVNWPADEVEINRCSGNMEKMIDDLGLRDQVQDCELPFAAFADAVAARAHLTGYSVDRLNRFVAWGRRSNASHVYWA